MASATSDLQTIREKVRRITATPSLDQMTNLELDQYINTFIQSDFPTLLKLFSLRTILTFYTQPGVDVYQTVTTPTSDPLFDFKNKYTAIHPPVFMAGVQSFFTQDRDVFYGNFPQTNFVQKTGLFGNGTPGPFVGILPPPINSNNAFTAIPHILQNSVLFSALDGAGTAMQLVDIPTTNVLGNLVIPGTTAPIYGSVNYVTGAYTFSFPSNTAIVSPTQANPIWSEAIYYVPGLPTTMLYYDNKFTLRPVPDKSYIVQVEANIIPTELLATNQVPNIKQFWQYIALGASRKVFQDRMDYDSSDRITPEFLDQQSMVNSTSMEQYTNQRTVTIYTNNGIANGWNNFGRWPY